MVKLTNRKINTTYIMQFLKHYFKTRGLRQIVQWSIIAAVSITTLSAFAVADAFAASTTKCVDLAGITTALAPPDSGTLDFESADPPSQNYAAKMCMEIDMENEIVKDLHMRGWVWDYNLGWISLYCDNGLNEGLPCAPSAMNYGVKVDNNTGEMYGWAWGDNIGWISFGCIGGLNDGFGCGGTNYAGNSSIKVDKSLGTLGGYAWADTVGWFNLSGAYAKILPLIIPQNNNESKIGVWTKVENAIQTGANKNTAPNKKTAPVADGKQGYDIFVHVADINGNPVVSGTPPELTVDFNASWADTVQFDQTVSETKNYSDNNDGPVSKPGIDASNKFAYPGVVTSGGVGDSYQGTVVSDQAPTTYGNCYDGDSDGSCLGGEGDWLYKDFGTGVPEQNIDYLGANVTITLDHGGAMGIETANYPIPSLTFNRLEFRPDIELTVFNKLFDPNNFGQFINYILSFRNVPDYYDVQGKILGLAPTAFKIDMLAETTNGITHPSVEYLWMDSIEDTIESGKKVLNFKDSMPSPNPLIAIPFAGDETIDPQIEGLRATSMVTVKTPKGEVKYYSNGLPRTPISLVTNQAAVFEGAVYSPQAAEVMTDVKITALGNLATNEFRNQLFRNVKGLVAGGGDGIIDAGGQKVILSKGGAYAKLGNNNRAFYVLNGDFVIDEMGANDRPFTFIVEGGDIFIKTNINAPAGAGTNPGTAVGIIALEDPETGLHGNVYIDSEVTDLLNVYIFADGSVFRSDDNICYYTGTYGAANELKAPREPNWIQSGRCDGGDPGSFVEPVMNLASQLYFKGTIASENCIGCSVKTEIYRGDGKRLGLQTPLNFAIGRLYDLHYFTYFRQLPDGSYSGTKSLSTSATQLAPAYFIYAPVPADLLGFN